uniref:Uncharacterized protein n=1 Tax=viral metagenome TaxID=1070528 RepID=A0A6C0E1H7_9ZZZZ
MEVFFTICQKIIKTTNLYYPCKTDTFQFCIDIYLPENRPFHKNYFMMYNMIHRMYHMSLNHKLTFHKIKFKILSEVLENIFFSKEYKETYFELFSKIQKIYFALIRIVYMCKIKHTKIQVDTDLLMNDLASIKEQNKITILQNNSKYIFSICDLVNVIETSITNAIDFFVEPFLPKNPYNNMTFNKSTLYNIYFTHKNSTFRLSYLFHLWFLHGFDLDKFCLENEATVRDFLIHKFIYNSPVNILYSKTLDMLHKNPYTKKLIIHKNFPKKTLVDIMRPFLFCEYMYSYGISGLEKTNMYKILLFYKLKKFYDYNNSFGRLQYKLTFNSKYEKKYVAQININHITYDQINVPSSIYKYSFEYNNDYQYYVNTYQYYDTPTFYYNLEDSVEDNDADNSESESSIDTNSITDHEEEVGYSVLDDESIS